ncbi:MAG: hypothetical protein KDE50_17390, partial [Caldilineaceae bacterium]|nr:hypothetical protein [Caldilineaceae bacterium]
MLMKVIAHTRRLFNAFMIVALVTGLIPPPSMSRVATSVLPARLVQTAKLMKALLPEMPVAQAAGTVNGAAFRDYNANGIQDANEPGIEGVIVTLYDDAGAVQGTGATAGNGAYSIAASGTGPYRVEFALPTDGSLDFLEPGAAGGTTVQFVPDGGATANVGFNNPGQYAPSDPQDLAAAVHSGSATYDNTAFTLIRFPETAGSTSTTSNQDYDSPIPTQLAQEDEMGAVWGLAYDRDHDQILAGAMVKRFARLADNATTIWTINADGSGVPSVWTTVDAARTDPHGAPNWAQDFAVVPTVGKDGLGDVDMAEDGSAVYTIDLLTREFVIIPVNANGSAGTIAKVALPTALTGCPTADDARPFGLGVNDGKVYVGYVCSAESTVSGLPIALSTDPKPGDKTKLLGYIYEWDGATSFSAVSGLDGFALDYERGCLNNGGIGNCTTFGNEAWNPWTPDYPFDNSINGVPFGYPQPIISDIEFDNGNIILGVMDRFGHMDGGYANEPPSGSFNGGQLTTAGDTLRACRIGAATWVMENLISGNSSCDTVGLGYDSSLNETIDEYYHDDEISGSGGAAPGNHADVSEGGLSVIPGRDWVITSVMDPNRLGPFSDGAGSDPWEDQGFHFYNNTTGDWIKGYRVVDDSQAGDSPVWGKGNGLGDIVALLAPAPIEIGNRVWEDTDGNGTQDPGEPPIAGVTVTLHDSSGAQLAAAVTDANGNYLFSNGAGTNTASAIYNISGLTYNTSGYEIRIANAEGGSQQAPLSGLFVTAANADAIQRDSDGALNGTTAQVAFDTGDPGANNHTYDFGFSSVQQVLPVTLQIIKQVSGGSVSAPFNVTVTGPNGYSNTTTVTPGAPTIITNLDLGTYTVVEESPITTAAPAGMAWFAPSYEPAGGSVSISSGMTGTITVTNYLGEEPIAPTGVLTVTKTVDWNGITPNPGQQFAYTIDGPDGFTPINGAITDGG